MNRQRLMYANVLVLCVLLALAGFGTASIITLAQGPTNTPAPTQADAPNQRGALGIGVAPSANGIQITLVQPGSAGEAAGLRVGDIILTVDNAPVNEVADLANALNAKRIGDSVVLGITRSGSPLQVTVTLAAQPPTATPRPSSTPRPTRTLRPTIAPIRTASFSRLGFTVQVNPTGTFRVTRVVANSPAARVPLLVNDEIINVNGTALNTATSTTVLTTLSTIRSGTLTLTFRRGTSIITGRLTVTATATPTRIGTLPPIARTPTLRPTLSFITRVQLGVIYDVVTQEVAAQRGLRENYGVIVVEVLANTPASAAELRVGDIILEVNGDRIDAKRPLNLRLAPYAPGDRVTLTIRRGTQIITVVVTLVTPRSVSKAGEG